MNSTNRRLAISNGIVNQARILGLLGRCQDQGRVRRGILGLVFADSCDFVSGTSRIATHVCIELTSKVT